MNEIPGTISSQEHQIYFPPPFNLPLKFLNSLKPVYLEIVQQLLRRTGAIRGNMRDSSPLAAKDDWRFLQFQHCLAHLHLPVSSHAEPLPSHCRESPWSLKHFSIFHMTGIITGFKRWKTHHMKLKLHYSQCKHNAVLFKSSIAL